jgi:hypothetical protein
MPELEQGAGDIAAIFASLEKINHRLDKLEKAAQYTDTLPDPLLSHPSREKFNVAEAVADSIFDAAGSEKACLFEPNGRPCDHCAMCGSRGF